MFVRESSICQESKKSNIPDKTVRNPKFDKYYGYCYNMGMLKRKRRSDRNHAIYCITNHVTNEHYIGITVVSSTVKRALQVRVRKHIQRAEMENKSWALCNSIRTYGRAAFTYGLLEVIRGKGNAHRRERELIGKFAPKLNSF